MGQNIAMMSYCSIFPSTFDQYHDIQRHKPKLPSTQNLIIRHLGLQLQPINIRISFSFIFKELNICFSSDMTAIGLLGISPEVVGQICDMLDLTSVINLLLTGSLMLERQVLRSTHSLIVNNRPGRLSKLPRLIYRFSCLDSLSIISPSADAANYVSQILVNELPKSLRSLTLQNAGAIQLLLFKPVFLDSIAPLSWIRRTPEEFKALFPSLESLSITSVYYANPEMKIDGDWTPLFLGLPRLNSLEIHGEPVSKAALESLPSLVTNLHANIVTHKDRVNPALPNGDDSPSIPPPPPILLPSNLETLDLIGGSLHVTTDLLAALPSSLTSLGLKLAKYSKELTNTPDLFWASLPKRLVRLMVGISLLLDANGARSLGPQQLQNLTILNGNFTWEAVGNLPRTLLSIDFHKSMPFSGFHRNVKNWPPMLTHANASINSVRPMHWKHLPRTICGPTIFIKDNDVEYMSDLPPALQNITITDGITADQLASMPCLTSLRRFSYDGPPPLAREYFQVLAQCPSLSSLIIRGGVVNSADIELLSGSLTSLAIVASSNGEGEAEGDDSELSEDESFSSSHGNPLWAFASFNLPWASKLEIINIRSNSKMIDPIMPPQDDSSISTTESCLPPSLSQWLTSLPTKLRSLLIQNTVLTEDDLKLVPPSLVNFSYGADPKLFAIRQLRLIPPTVENLEIYIKTRDTVTFITSVDELAECLPPNLSYWHMDAMTGITSDVWLKLSDPPTKDLAGLLKKIMTSGRFGLTLYVLCKHPTSAATINEAEDLSYVFGMARRDHLRETVDGDLKISSLALGSPLIPQ